MDGKMKKVGLLVLRSFHKMIIIEQYKVYNPELQLYSKGGAYCRSLSPIHWGKKGKIWSSAGALRRHLFQYCSENGYRSQNNIPEHWEVHAVTTDAEGKLQLTVFNAKKFYDKTHLQDDVTVV